jgi:kynureninase
VTRPRRRGQESAGLAAARALDAEDPLRSLRARFALPADVIYLDGESLGAMPAATPGRVSAVTTHEWGEDLIRSWNTHDWIAAPSRLGAKIARLIGARPDEVVVADSTSVNLYKLIRAVMAVRGRKGVVVAEAGDFPTDAYVAAGALSQAAGWRLDLRPRAEIAEAIRPGVDLLVLSHVHYKTAARHDLVAVTRKAHEAGAIALWDLSHSAGAIALDLDGANADLAVGCGYKYLNGGPGAPAFLFVAERWREKLSSPINGWMGHAAPFAFAQDYAPADGAMRFLCGTPPILSMAALEVGVDQFDGVEVNAAEQKSQRLADYLIFDVEARCAGLGLQLITPRRPAERGCHVSFTHPDAWPVMQALIERGVIGDMRAPDVLRFGLPALYVSFEDLWRAVGVLGDVLRTGAWNAPRFHARRRVT